MKLDIQPLSQRDSRWASQKLGSSASSIGDYGCVITAVSMLCTYFQHPILPDALNIWLTNNAGYANRNLLKWESISSLFPDIHWDSRIDCPDTPAPLDKIDEYLNTKKPVIALVDFNPATKELDQHFVLIIGKDNHDYFINDPWTGETYFLSAKYGPPAKAICGLRLYSGPVPEEKPPEVTPAPQNNTSERLVKVEEGLSQTKDELAKNTRRLDDLQKSLDIVSADRQILEDIQGKQAEVREAVRLISENLATTKKELRDEIRSAVDNLDGRVKKLENPPLKESEVSIWFSLGKMILGRRK